MRLILSIKKELMIIKCLYRLFPRGCQCQAGQQGTPTSAQPGNKILMIIAPQLATSVTQKSGQKSTFLHNELTKSTRGSVPNVDIVLVISANLDLALLMAAVHHLSCLTRGRCVRILGRKFGEGTIFGNFYFLPVDDIQAPRPGG